MSTLVIGTGLLGSALLRKGGNNMVALRHIPWGDPVAARHLIATAVQQHVARTADWSIAWCAGAGIVGSEESHLRQETSYLSTVLDTSAAAATGPGRLVLTSSAGGVHGRGSPDRIDERTAPDPVSAYGRNKVVQEQLVTRWAAATGNAALIARPSNIYGPGQHLGKAQGLVTQILWRSITHQPIVLSVPEETQRDFVYVDDVASRMLQWLRSSPSGAVDLRVMAAGRSITLSRLFSLSRHITGLEPRIIRAAPAQPGLQPLQLRFRSTASATDGPSTPIEVGMAATWRHLVVSFGRSGLQQPA